MKSILTFVVASAAFCQNAPPNLINAQLEIETYSGNLQKQIRAGHPTWFGYAVKSVHRDGNCCWNGVPQAGCWLEDNRHSAQTYSGSSRPVPLEGSDAAAILFRVEGDSIEKVRAFSLCCPLDAAGLPFVWLTGVPTEASLLFLRDIIANSGSNHIADGAVFAVSQHDDSRGLDLLIELASKAASPHVREQSLFWLSQRAGERAAATISNAIENDPDTDVKRKAVFALSQLPKEEAVPKLIQVARTQRNPEVRKQAFFWLGQSKDPRALAFIEDVLTK